jgi:hypothetical protein
LIIATNTRPLSTISGLDWFRSIQHMTWSMTIKRPLVFLILRLQTIDPANLKILLIWIDLHRLFREVLFDLIISTFELVAFKFVSQLHPIHWDCHYAITRPLLAVYWRNFKLRSYVFESSLYFSLHNSLFEYFPLNLRSRTLIFLSGWIESFDEH